MAFALKTHRSAGVRVTAAVHRQLVRGNAARDRMDWSGAAAAYQAALHSDPALTHIWVQLGHALKEQGHTAAAEAAYLSATRLKPDDADAYLHLGHLFNIGGDHTSAGRYYLQAFQANPRVIDAATALHRAIARARGRKRAELIGILRAASPGSAPLAITAPNAATGTTLAFDVSDLIGYYAHGRPPTGIQRVQIQIITNALARAATPIRLCCFIEGRDDWLEVPADALSHVIALSLTSSDRNDPEWISALHQLHLRLALAPAFAFPRGAFLINLGSSWQLYNYFLFVRAAQAQYGVRYIPFVHDLIPVMAPQHFVKAARREVIPWVIGMLEHADHMLVNSEATKRDLLQTATLLVHRLDPANIAVIRLDADARTPTSATPTPATAEAPEPGPYALLVSTVESRKGHAVAFAAWQQLIARHGAAKVPKLVCVGKRGWLSAGAYQMLEDDKLLASRVDMVSAVSETRLAALYRGCLFTLYPSSYEGWGLPITEALCYGKPVIASDTSSLPEAGGDFAVYVPPGSATALAGAVERMTFDAPYREAIAARIASGFRPRQWRDLAEQVETELLRMAARDPAPVSAPRPIARLGAYHALGRSTALRLWPGAGAGEMFRTGTGWAAPEIAGSWTRMEGGQLAIGLPPHTRPLRIGLLLLGSPHDDVDWRIQVRHGPSLAGSLGRHGRKWVTLTATAQDLLELRLLTEPGEHPDGQEPENEAVIGLAGFFLYEQDDIAASMQLLEAIALGNLDAVDAYRERTPETAAPDWT